jgi:hypothetical protein
MDEMFQDDPMSDGMLPDDDSDDSSDWSKPSVPFWHCWVVLGTLIFLQTILAFALFDPPSGEKYFFLALLGTMFSQPLLFALWAAFAPQKFSVRFFSCMVLCSLVAFVFELKNSVFIRTSPGPVFMIGDLAIFLLAAPILLLFRRFSGWQLTHGSLADAESDYLPLQFGIKHLLVVTAVTAFVLALFKSLTAVNSRVWESDYGMLARIVTEITLMSVPLVLLFGFALLRDIGESSVMLGVFALLVMEIAVFFIVPWMERSRGEMYGVVFFFQLGAGLSVLFYALVIRSCGFRMVRQRS